MTTISNYDIPFLFRTLYDRSRLFCFMTMSFLSQRFCSSVQILAVFPCGIFGNEWVVLLGLGVLLINTFKSNIEKLLIHTIIKIELRYFILSRLPTTGQLIINRSTMNHVTQQQAATYFQNTY